MRCVRVWGRRIKRYSRCAVNAQGSHLWQQTWLSIIANRAVISKHRMKTIKDKSMKEKKRNPFKLQAFRGINPEIVERLKAFQIRTADQMLAAGKTKESRSELAQKTGVAESDLLELVKLSDLSRLPGVKGIRARLYYDAGIDCVEKIASWEPEALRLMVSKYVEQTNFNGIPPLPKEVSSTIENARRMPSVVQF